MSKEEILQAGIAVAKAGDRVRAASFFAEVVKIDPSSEQGWFLLGICCSAIDQREYCFRRVLALNPNNLEARKKLERLSKPMPAPVWASQPLPTAAESTPKPYIPTTPTVQPVEKSWEPVKVEEINISSPPVTQVLPKVDKSKTTSPKRKISNKTLVLLLLFTPTLLVCGLGVAYLLFSGHMTKLSSPSFFTVQTPLPFPAVAITQTSIFPTATLSPTPPPTVIPSPKPTVSYTPLMENTSCQFDVPGGADVSCGYVIVPEDRTGDPSHTIKLAFTVYHSTSQNPAEPVLFLQGGPGAEAVKLSADAYAVLVVPFLQKHDFIVFDQRGTGLSKPALECDELTKIFSHDIHGLIPSSTRELVYSNAFLSCQGLMSAQGINLNAYTTIASAADVKDLITMLGYQKADLYGASYGTRLAQVIMRDYPEIVHSAILDSVVPVESDLFSRYPDAIDSGLKALFQSCAANPECNAAYPNLETVFWDLVNKLDAKPVTVTTSDYPTGTITETVNGSTVMSVVLGSIKYSHSMISTAPQTIYRFNGGDYSTLVLSQSSMPYMFEGMSPGLFISMMCHEQVLATTPEELQAASSRQIIRDYAWLPYYGDMNDVYKTCKSWRAMGPSFGENDPVISDIPSLIITGKFDPTTPPMYARQVASHLSHSYYFEFPNLGHTPTATDTSGCAMDIVLAFLNDPTTEPDRTCLNEIANTNFVVPYTGNPALSLKTVQAYGISIDIPKDWHTLFGGFYSRGNSPLDITEVGILRVPISSKQIQDWFSLEAYGYRGLDGALVEAGKRHANGMTWTLYLSSSYGRPVDIAMTDYGVQALVVALFSNSDEHDALYRTVFLPMVDSARR